MNECVSDSEVTDAPVLRSIADSIEPLYPSAASTLRGIARKIEENI
jgi:hypothetical protein